MKDEEPSEEEQLRRVDKVVGALFQQSPIGVYRRRSAAVQQILPSGRMAFGVWSGPKLKVDILLHEMAHFVEIDRPRMALDDYGLKLPNQQFIPGRYPRMICHPKTMNMIARELRVYAWQRVLSQRFDDVWSPEGIAELMAYLPDWYNVPGRSTEARSRWVAAQVRRLYAAKKYSWAAFLREWRERNSELVRRYKRRKVPVIFGGHVDIEELPRYLR